MSWKAPCFLGVDPSTRKLAYVVVGDPPGMILRKGELVAKGQLAEDRFDELIGQFETVLLSFDRVPHVTIEGVPFVKNRKGAMALATILGGLKAVCVVLEAPYSVVPGYDWKRELGLSGNANKDAIRAYAETEGPVDDTWSQDEVDAWCLAECGRRVA